MSDPKLRNFHEAKWDEPVIFEQSVPGSRSILFPDVSQKAMPVTGDVSDLLDSADFRTDSRASYRLPHHFSDGFP
mgnify:FL=1